MYYIMDAIGTLAAFAPSDLQSLRYIAVTASRAGNTININQSKFIIVFNPYAAEPSISISNIIAPGGECHFSLDHNQNAFDINLNSTGNIIIASSSTGVFYISIAYCPY